MPTAHATAIGRIAIAHASLEHIVELACWHLLDISSNEGVLISAEMQYQGKCELLAGLTAVKGEREAFNPLLKRLKSFGEERNRYLHGAWRVPNFLANAGKSEPSLLSVRGKFSHNKRRIGPSEQVAVETLEAVATAGDELANDLVNFLYRMSGMDVTPLLARFLLDDSIDFYRVT